MADSIINNLHNMISELKKKVERFEPSENISGNENEMEDINQLIKKIDEKLEDIHDDMRYDKKLSKNRSFLSKLDFEKGDYQTIRYTLNKKSEKADYYHKKFQLKYDDLEEPEKRRTAYKANSYQIQNLKNPINELKYDVDKFSYENTPENRIERDKIDEKIEKIDDELDEINERFKKYNFIYIPDEFKAQKREFSIIRTEYKEKFDRKKNWYKNYFRRSESAYIREILFDIITYQMKRLYKPINKLKDKVEEFVPTNNKSQNEKEMEVIDERIDEIKESLREISLDIGYMEVDNVKDELSLINTILNQIDDFRKELSLIIDNYNKKSKKEEKIESKEIEKKEEEEEEKEEIDREDSIEYKVQAKNNSKDKKNNVYLDKEEGQGRSCIII